MKQKILLKGRRIFLKTGLLVAGTAAIGAGLNYAISPETRSIARILIHYLDYTDLAEQLGKSILKDNPALAALDIDAMTDLALKDAGLTRDDLSYFSLVNNIDDYRKQVHKEFDLENIVHVDGWIISRTEAHLCALLVAYDNTYGSTA